jgi:hypothetical protein
LLFEAEASTKSFCESKRLSDGVDGSGNVYYFSKQFKDFWTYQHPRRYYYQQMAYQVAKDVQHLKVINTLLDIGSYAFIPLWPLSWLANKTINAPKAGQSTFSKTVFEKVLLPAVGVQYYSKYIGAADRKYVDQWEIYLVDHWGIADDFSEKAAECIVLFSKYGLRPQIASGYRSTEKQQELYDRWLKGDKTVFTPAKPGTSPHERVNWLGRPAARCFDCQLTDYLSGAKIAQALGISYGYPSDPVHFGELRQS